MKISFLENDFKGTVLKLYFWVYFLRKQFWECIFEGAVLKMYFWECIFWESNSKKCFFCDSNFENVFPERGILKMYFLKDQFWKSLMKKNTLYKFLSFFNKKSLSFVYNSYSEKESLKIRKVTRKTGNFK